MTPRGVLVVADAEQHILGRLSRAWIRYSSSRLSHELVYASTTHPYEVCRRARRAGCVLWVNQIAFSVNPGAAGVPQCVMVHHLNEPERARFVRRLLPFVDAVATSSVRWQRWLREVADTESTLVPYVLDTEAFRPVDRGATRDRFGLDAGEFVVGFSAKALADAYGRKGIDLFVTTVAAASTIWPDIAVFLIGTGLGPLARKLEGIGIRVVHREPSRTEETAAFYPAMDVFLCTSNEEGGPCTILEAMACGVPVITTDVGHVPEVIADGETGFVVREREPQAFIARIRLIRADDTRRVRMIRAAREFVVAHRDERTVVPSIPFDSMYRQADERFRGRTRPEVAARGVARFRLASRYAARRIASSIHRRGSA